MTDFLAAASLIAGHAARKLLKPYRDARWRRASAPFWHRAARGLKFELQPGEVVDYHIYTEGLFEKRFLHQVERLFKGAACALDVGANIGNHALFLAGIFDEVHAFEPNPSTLARLARHVAANKAANVRVYPFGLSDRNGELFFAEHPGGNAGAGRFVGAAHGATQALPVRRGDDALKEAGVAHVDFIKIDVEGHELAALEGLAATIAACRPAIAFEFHPQDFEARYFENFRRALPGYRFFECALKAGRAGFLHELTAFLMQGGLPRVVPLNAIEMKSYPNILALPEGFAAPTGAGRNMFGQLRPRSGSATIGVIPESAKRLSGISAKTNEAGDPGSSLRSGRDDTTR